MYKKHLRITRHFEQRLQKYNLTQEFVFLAIDTIADKIYCKGEIHYIVHKNKLMELLEITGLQKYDFIDVIELVFVRKVNSLITCIRKKGDTGISYKDLIK